MNNTIPLKELVALTVSNVDKKVSDKENEVLLCNYMDVYSNSFVHSNLSFMKATASDSEIQKCRLLSGDVVITKDSESYDDIGVPALVRESVEKLICGYHLAILRPCQEMVIGEFLFYALQTVEAKHQFSAFANGVTRFGLRINDILRVEIPVPSLRKQLAISHILCTLDDKIELNRRMNETLEELARTLFKSWFVNFDPVRAKMKGIDPGLPKQIADLFPDHFVDSELGEIPEGWERYRLDELAKHHSFSISPYKDPLTKFEHFSIPAYDNSQYPLVELGASIKSNKTVVNSGAILLSKLNPKIPRVWMPSGERRITQICSTEFLVFTEKFPGNRYLLFSLFTSNAFRSKMRSMVTGTSKSHQRVPTNALKSQYSLTGSPDIFDNFGKLTAPLFNQIIENRSESIFLTKIRDALLPKLISGEIELAV